MIAASTGELSFNAGAAQIGPRTTLAALARLPVSISDAPGPDLVPAMRTKALGALLEADGMRFDARLDFLHGSLTAVRLMAKAPQYPPDLADWDLAREMARHDYHCLWIRRSLGRLWRLRRYPWGRVQALCGRNLDETPRESVIKVIYVDFAEIEAAVARDFESA